MLNRKKAVIEYLTRASSSSVSIASIKNNNTRTHRLAKCFHCRDSTRTIFRRAWSATADPSRTPWWRLPPWFDFTMRSAWVVCRRRTRMMIRGCGASGLSTTPKSCRDFCANRLRGISFARRPWAWNSWSFRTQNTMVSFVVYCLGVIFF